MPFKWIKLLVFFIRTALWMLNMYILLFFFLSSVSGFIKYIFYVAEHDEAREHGGEIKMDDGMLYTVLERSLIGVLRRVMYWKCAGKYAISAKY